MKYNIFYCRRRFNGTRKIGPHARSLRRSLRRSRRLSRRRSRRRPWRKASVRVYVNMLEETVLVQKGVRQEAATREIVTKKRDDGTSLRIVIFRAESDTKQILILFRNIRIISD